PCEGWGSESESRLPLQILKTPFTSGNLALGDYIISIISVNGRVEEWSCRGLQLRVRRFDSDPSLHFPSSSKSADCSYPLWNSISPQLLSSNFATLFFRSQFLFSVLIIWR